MRIERINSIEHLTGNVRSVAGSRNIGLLKTQNIKCNDEFISFNGSKDVSIKEISRQLEK